eukprot:4139547-Heterocapsa_arctica.AAC.1
MEPSGTQSTTEVAHQRTHGPPQRYRTYQRWPHGLHPIIALIAKEGAENEGQLRPIAILPYVYRVWMA